MVSKEIKYEFFLIFLGLAPIIATLWMIDRKMISLPAITTQGFIIAGLTLGIGLFIFLLGFFELYTNYHLEKGIRLRQELLERYRLDRKIKKLPKPYSDEFEERISDKQGSDNPEPEGRFKKIGW